MKKLLLILLVGCSQVQTQEPQPEPQTIPIGEPIGQKPQAPTELDKKVTELFSARCDECHNQQSKRKIKFILNDKLNSFTNKELWQIFYRTQKEEGRMPKGDAPLNKEEAIILMEWVNERIFKEIRLEQ